tara:strand:+ start:283 stop:558 length:276 start_codon:yes stop_codon:yes gene_type:complete
MSKCVICEEKFEGKGHNPEPVFESNEGRACDGCNFMVVVPVRCGKLYKCTRCGGWFNENDAMVLAEAELGLSPVESYIVCCGCYEVEYECN